MDDTTQSETCYPVFLSKLMMMSNDIDIQVSRLPMTSSENS